MVPISDFGIDAVTQKLITSMRAIAANENTKAVAAYNAAVDNWNHHAEWTHSVNEWRVKQTPPLAPFSLRPPPAPPDLLVVNEAFIAMSESGFLQAANLDYSNIFIRVPYVPISAPHPAPPALVIGDPIPGLPGMFTSRSGDSGAIPAGYRHQQDGNEYVKILAGPMGSAMWQQVAERLRVLTPQTEIPPGA
jgi:hypothetical protein